MLDWKEKLQRTGRLFFAAGLLGIGVEHFIFEDFIAGRAPRWPGSWPGHLFWAYFSGTIIIITSLLMFAGKRARVALLISSVMIFMWSLVRHVPVVAAEPFLSGAWTAAGKALVFITGMLAVSTTFPQERSWKNTWLQLFVKQDRAWVITGRIGLGIFLVITGIQHFLFAGFVASLIPDWFPGDPVFWTYFAGVALISGGAGLFIPATASLAAFLSGLMIFSWFWIVHVPRISVSLSDKIAVFEALAFSGVAWVLVTLKDELGGGS